MTIKDKDGSSDSQGGEAVEVVAWQDAENPLYTTAERRVMHDWAGNGYPIVELMTVAQHQRIVAAQRIKTCIALKERNDAREALTHPADQVAEPDAELVELLRSKFPRIDPCQPVPLDEKAHCCEYTIYVERERLHRIIDAKMASLEVKP